MLTPEKYLEDREDKDLEPMSAYTNLKFLSGEESRNFWYALRERRDGCTMDRETEVRGMWRLFERSGAHANLLSKDRLSRGYHRRRLFDWFLGRYALDQAAATYEIRGSAEAVRGFLLALFFGLVTIWPNPLLGGGRGYVLSVLGGYAAAIAFMRIGGRARGLGVYEAASMLIPRLGATVLVGLLFILTSTPVGDVILARGSWLAVLALVALSGFYLLLEMGRRLTPLPPRRQLVLRVGAVLMTGIIHAIGLTLIISPTFRKEGGLNIAGPRQLCAIAACALLLGIVLNIIWQEESVTTPI